LYFVTHRVTLSGYDLLFVHRENASLVWWKRVKRRKWFVPERRKERSKIKGREAITVWVENPKNWCRSGHNQIKVTSGIESTSSWGVLFQFGLVFGKNITVQMAWQWLPPSFHYMIRFKGGRSLHCGKPTTETPRTLISPEIPGYWIMSTFWSADCWNLSFIHSRSRGGRGVQTNKSRVFLFVSVNHSSCWLLHNNQLLDHQSLGVCFNLGKHFSVQ